MDYPSLLLTRITSGYLFKGHGERQLGWVDDQLYKVPRLRRLSYHQYVLLTARPTRLGRRRREVVAGDAAQRVQAARPVDADEVDDGEVHDGGDDAGHRPRDAVDQRPAR